MYINTCIYAGHFIHNFSISKYIVYTYKQYVFCFQKCSNSNEKRSEEEVRDKLDKAMEKGYKKIQLLSKHRGCTLREAAFIYSLEKLDRSQK